MVRFITLQFCCTCKLTETAQDGLLCRIPTFYKRLETPQWFHFEMDKVFSYKGRALVDDVQSGLY